MINPTGLDLGDIRVLPVMDAGALGVIPLENPDSTYFSCRTLDEALAAGVAEVTEVSESGRVSELRFLNRGDLPVLLLDGEEVVGSKQNRVMNLTVLAPAEAETIIPVSCTEQGRWRWQSRRFAATDRILYASARQRKLEQVSHCLDDSGRRHSDQHDIWRDIADKSARMRAFSDTGAASALYESRAGALDNMVKSIAPLPGQTGAVVLLNGGFAGLELFASDRLFARALPKLVRSYGLDALDRSDRDLTREDETTNVAARILRQIEAAGLTRHKAIGLGEDLRFSSGEIVGAALANGGRLVHLTALPKSPS